MATDKRPSLDEIFGTTTSAEKPINTVAERPSLDEIFGPSDEKKEQPKTNEWGEPIYPFEKPVEVEGARLNDFLTPTIFEQKPNAKSETERPKAIKEEKPYSPEGLLPIAESGQAEMPQSFTGKAAICSPGNRRWAMPGSGNWARILPGQTGSGR